MVFAYPADSWHDSCLFLASRESSVVHFWSSSLLAHIAVQAIQDKITCKASRLGG